MMASYKRIMGLDVGDKKIGVSISDPLLMAANPWGYVNNRKQGLEEIGNLICQYEIEDVVVGIPKNMDGSEGFQAKAVRNFIKKLQASFGVTIIEMDERLTTKEAESLLIEAGVSRKKRKILNDKIAASLILQKYLYRLSNTKEGMEK